MTMSVPLLNKVKMTIILVLIITIEVIKPYFMMIIRFQTFQEITLSGLQFMLLERIDLWDNIGIIKEGNLENQNHPIWSSLLKTRCRKSIS
jgi:hypothetical protein